MADGVKESSKPIVHQALHGYADGHQQLAISVTLKPRDQKTLLALSDISGPGARLDEDGYLTGYPLHDSGFFAIGRTWPAPEMPRPGCVWTHTLLIDFNDLAGVESLTSLLKVFKRPTGFSSFQEYAKPTRINTASFPTLSSFAEAWAKPVLAALYGKPKNKIVATRSGPEVDTAVLAIWSQQWPRLRRSFRFCTFAASDRSVEGASFDLQILPSSDRSVRSRFSEIVDAGNVKLNVSPWVEDALLDLAHPDQSGLRSFFRRLGSDVAGGREVFRPLCRLHRAVEISPQNPVAVHEAISLLQGELGTKQARSARAVVAKSALETVDTLDEMSFDFLWANLNLVEPDVLKALATRLGRTTWHRDPRKLVQLLNSESAEKIVLHRVISELEISELIEGIKITPELFSLALSHRPELIKEPNFWLAIKTADESFGVVENKDQQLDAIAAMLAAGRNDLAPITVRTFGPIIVLEGLSKAKSIKDEDLSLWVKAASVDIQSVAGFLGSRINIPRKIIYTLAKILPPDLVPNDYGEDPWLVAWRNSMDSIDDSQVTYLLVYFLNRALGWRSKSQAELLQLSFEPIHNALARNSLPEDYWRTFESRLPWSIFWLTWDRCQRLRAGVIDKFVDRDLSPQCFVRLTHSDVLFYALIGVTAQSNRGRNYLKRVYWIMKSEEDANLAGRILAIEELIGRKEL